MGGTKSTGNGKKMAVGWGGLALAMTVAFVWSAALFFRAPDPATTALISRPYELWGALIGGGLGKIIFITLVVFAALYFLYLKRRTMRPGKGLLFIFLAACLPLIVSLAAIATVLHSESPGVADANNEYHSSVQRETDSLTRQLKGVNLAGVLQPRSLAQDKDLRYARSMTAAAKQMLAEYDTKRATLRNDYVREISNLGLPKQASERVIRETLASERNLDDTINYERDLVDAVDETVDFLASSRRDWEISGGEIVFRKPSALTNFRKHIAEIQRLAQAESNLTNAIAQGQTIIHAEKP